MAIFTLPPYIQFLPALAQFVLQDAQNAAPLALANTQIFLPTRRACMALEQALFKALSNHALVLPRITPVRDVAELPIDAADLLSEIPPVFSAAPKTVTQFERVMTLAKLVYQWKVNILTSRLAQMEETDKIAYLHGFEDALSTRVSHAECIALAQTLGNVLDQMTLEQVPIEALKAVVPEAFLTHNELSLAFLQIIQEQWPKHLQEIDAIDPIAAWNTAMQNVNAAIAAQPNMRVIIAGSTGSTPATAQLLCTIAKHPNGTVILPGLDTHIDAQSWHYVGQNLRKPHQQFAETHPQLHLKHILELLQISHPSEVAQLPILHNKTPYLALRNEIFSHALMPVETTQNWQKFSVQNADEDITNSLQGISIVHAAFEEEEANIIAQEILKTARIEDKTLAIITPNRTLARRVCAMLKNYGVEIEDSGGVPLMETEAGRVLRHILAVLQNPNDVAAILALAHNAHVNFIAQQHSTAILALERALFRGIALSSPVETWPEILQKHQQDWQNWHNKVEGAPYPTQAQKELTLSDWAQAETILTAIVQLLQPWTALHKANTPTHFAQCVAVLTQVFEAITNSTAQKDPSFATVMSVLIEAGGHAQQSYVLPVSAFPAAFEVILQQAPSVVKHGAHQRIHILGALEARLHTYDKIILAGLNEGMWPPSASIDPWLNRSARTALKMPMPERRIALSAHDFVQFMGHEHVMMTRSLREGGAPTLPSRFLQRLSAVVGEAHYQALIARGDEKLTHIRAQHANISAKPLQEPKPKTPISTRPTSLSVTRVETLIQNPYGIYAEYILKLKPFEPLQVPPNAAQKGTLIHAGFEHLARSWQFDDAHNMQDLQQFFMQKTANLPQKEQLFWRAQLNGLLAPMLDFERTRRPNIQEVMVECTGKADVPLEDATFHIHGRADRIEIGEHGLTLMDFKTGNVPDKKHAKAGLYAQFPLLTHIAQAGGFGKKLQNIPLNSAIYVGFEEKMTSIKNTIPFGEQADFEKEIVEQISGIKMALAKSLNENFEYRVKPYRAFLKKHSDYDHLSRIAEWGILQDEEGEYENAL